MGAWRDGQLATTIFRPSTIFGPDDSFINRFASLLKISPVLPLARSNTRFAPVYVGDVVEAFACALETEESHGRIYELCGSEVWSLKELVVWTRDLLGLKRLVIGLPNILGRLQGLVFGSCSRQAVFQRQLQVAQARQRCCTDNGLLELGIEPWGLSQLVTDLAGPGRASAALSEVPASGRT